MEQLYNTVDVKPLYYERRLDTNPEICQGRMSCIHDGPSKLLTIVPKSYGPNYSSIDDKVHPDTGPRPKVDHCVQK